MVNYTENVAHTHGVDTRPSFPLPLRRPGDEASTRHDAKMFNLHAWSVYLLSSFTNTTTSQGLKYYVIKK